MRHLAVFVFLFYLLVGVLGAEESFKTVVKTVNGYGTTEKEAINDALIEAIKQVYGVNLEGVSSVSVSHSEVYSTGKYNYSEKSELERTIKERFKGFVQNYQVLDIKREKDGTVKATVRAYVKVYVTPGFSPDTRRKMAIYPFEVEETNLLFPKEKLSRLFTQALITYMTHTRKFTILDRTDKAYFYRELAEVTGVSAHPRELAKLGKRLGADYLLVGKVVSLTKEEKTEGSKELGWYTQKQVLKFAVTYKVIAFATGQVKYSNELTGEVEVKKINYPNLIKAFEEIAQRIEKDVLFAIYPPKVIWVEGNTVYVNYGNKSLSVGDKFTVYKKGKRLRDPYSGEFLEYTQEKIGVLKITETFPKYSIGEVIEGRAEVGAILRPYREKTSSNGGSQNAQSNVEVLPGGGVKLPWDK